MKGRPAKPLEQRKREGNPRQHKIPEPVLIGGRKRPDMPRGFTDEQKRLWKLLVDDLDGSGTLDHADGGMVEATVVFWSRARQARRRLNKEGLTMATLKGGLMSRPEVAIERESWAQFRQIADHLGLSPATRAKLGIAGVKGRSPAGELESEAGDRRQKLRAVK